MKPFIIFTAVLLLFAMCISYAVDNQVYVSELNSLKAAAEECAASAALEIEDEYFAEGEIVIDEEKGEIAAQKHFEHYLEHICIVQVKESRIEMEFEKARVTVKLYLETKDLFSLPFLSVNRLCRVSTYEYV